VIPAPQVFSEYQTLGVIAIVGLGFLALGIEAWYSDYKRRKNKRP